MEQQCEQRVLQHAVGSIATPKIIQSTYVVVRHSEQNTGTILEPGSTIGILGGGQLGQMLAVAASRLGFICHIYTDSPESPATRVAALSVHGDYGDIKKVKAFAETVDVLTYEFENVPAKAAEAAQPVTQLRPDAKALEIAQDRLTEKTFISEVAGVPVTPFYPIEDFSNLKNTING